MSKHVVIFAGGKGSRLGYEGQKCMVPINGRPFLAYKLDQLQRHGATHFHFLVAHKAEEVRDFFGEDEQFTYHYDDGLGRDVAYGFAMPYLPIPHWWTYGDVLLDVPLLSVVFGYHYANDEFEDAGLGYRDLTNIVDQRPVLTDELSYHINTPEDLARTEAYLATVHR